MLLDQLHKMKFDVRMLERNLKKKFITNSEYEKHLQALSEDIGEDISFAKFADNTDSANSTDFTDPAHSANPENPENPEYSQDSLEPQNNLNLETQDS